MPLIIRDQFRGFIRRGGVRMQAPLVFRPFASDSNNILTWRNRGILPASREGTDFWGPTTGSEVDGSGERVSLSDRLKGRGWNSTVPQTFKIPGLVNTG